MLTPVYKACRYDCNILCYYPLHQKETKTLMGQESGNKWLTPNLYFVQTHFNLKNGLTKYIGILYAAVWYSGEFPNKNCKLFTSNYKKIICSHITTFYCNFFKVSKYYVNGHTSLCTLKLPTTLVNKLIPYLIKLYLKWLWFRFWKL